MDHRPATWITSLARFLATATATQPTCFLRPRREQGRSMPGWGYSCALPSRATTHCRAALLFFCPVSCTAAAAGLGVAHSPVLLRGGSGIGSGSCMQSLRNGEWTRPSTRLSSRASLCSPERLLQICVFLANHCRAYSCVPYALSRSRHIECACGRNWIMRRAG